MILAHFASTKKSLTGFQLLLKIENRPFALKYNTK